MESTIGILFNKIKLILRKIISFLILTSVFLGIIGSFMVIFSGFLYNIFVLNSAIITFLMAFGIYGLNKLTDLKEDAINIPERAIIIRKIEPLLKISIAISFLLSLILGFLENIFILLILIVPLFLGILYSMSFSKNLPRLKEITGVKNLTIALSWAVVATFIPVMYVSEKKITLIISIFIFFF